MRLLRDSATMYSTSSLRGVPLAILVAAINWLSAAAPVGAVVVFSDGFGDADRNNNGVALEIADVDQSGFAGAGIGTYTPARASNPDPNPDPLIDDRATNAELTTVLDASDVGIRWLSHARFTNSNTGDPAAQPRIVDDTQGVMLETKPTSTVGGLGITAIDDGYALSQNQRGRGTSIAGFFDQTIDLGPEVGDQVKVSFDVRVWRDAPNANAVEQPRFSELRFGLFEDTDNQLGQTNPVAGRNNTPAVWGQEDGGFEGNSTNPLIAGSEIGTPGDHGWYGSVIWQDPNVTPFPTLIPNGGAWRIREETNEGTASHRIMQGDPPETDTVATPVPATPGGTDFDLINLDVNKVYNLSLTLQRATDVAPGDTILAILTAKDRATGISYTLSDTEPLFQNDGMGGMIPDGIFSDSWDYFAMRGTGTDDMDMVIDNFLLEQFGSNAIEDDADFDDDGDVDGGDFLTWQRNVGTAGSQMQGNANNTGLIDGADLAIWRSQFGPAAVAAASAIPEPSGLLPTIVGLLSLAARRRRSLRVR